MSISAELIQRVLITDIVGVNYLRPSLINSFKKFLRSGYQGVKFFFFSSDSHLASKFFKVVANSKNVGRHF